MGQQEQKVLVVRLHSAVAKGLFLALCLREAHGGAQGQYMIMGIELRSLLLQVHKKTSSFALVLVFLSLEHVFFFKFQSYFLKNVVTNCT